MHLESFDEVLNIPIRKYYKGKSDQWELVAEVEFKLNDQKIIMPKGYITDFASAPFWCPNWLIPRHGRTAIPSAWHDLLCEYALVKRSIADRVFLELMKRAGVPAWQRILMYGYVRALGWIRYGEKVN